MEILVVANFVKLTIQTFPCFPTKMVLSILTVRSLQETTNKYIVMIKLYLRLTSIREMYPDLQRN